MKGTMITRVAAAALAAGIGSTALASSAHAVGGFDNPYKDVEAPGFVVGPHWNWNSNPVGAQEECVRDQQLLAGDGAETTSCGYRAGAWTFYWRHTN